MAERLERPVASGHESDARGVAAPALRHAYAAARQRFHG